MSFKVLKDDVSQQLQFEDQRRLLSRVAISISLVLTIYLIIVCIVMPVMTIGKWIAALAAVLIGSLSLICHNKKLYKASAATIVATTIIGGFVASLSNGGADGFVAPIMISAPLVAAVFLGARATVVSAILVVIAIASLYFLEQAGFVTEAPYSEDTLNIAAIVMLSASTGICASGVGYFAHAMQTQIGSLVKSREQLVELSERLDHSAHHDALTDIANRHGLQRYLETLFEDPSKRQQDICLIHVDLDNFKVINDSYGHPIGDAVLRHTADIMRSRFSNAEIVSRVGGDEFVIILVGEAVDLHASAGAMSDALLVDLKTPVEFDRVECRVSASIGFAISPIADASVDSLMTDADLALYEVKRAGRGQAKQFEHAMRVKMQQHRKFVFEVEEAIIEDRVEAVLQPQICLCSDELKGMEGLGRIRNRLGELLPPGDIIPILGEQGLLKVFDRKVMQRSLDALVSMRRAGFEVPYVSVNASSDSLRSPDYVEIIQTELQKRHLCEDDIVVEILESTLIESLDDPAAMSILALRRSGIRAIMDDFGSEHATIANLMKLDIDGLKIDRSLIANLTDRKTLEVVKAVLGISERLNLSVVVEGVETPRQFSILKKMGCSVVQGFGICRPQEYDGIIAWLKRHNGSKKSGAQKALIAS